MRAIEFKLASIQLIKVITALMRPLTQRKIAAKKKKKKLSLNLGCFYVLYLLFTRWLKDIIMQKKHEQIKNYFDN
jgi:hypothetical protein